MKRNYHTNLAFLDLLFNTLLCFAMLFCLAFILINPARQDKNSDINAGFIITVVWPASLNDDVDTYVSDPQNNLVAYMRREQGLMHLDRDDVGFKSDRIVTPSGVVEFKENREVVTLRGTLSGEYVVNVHWFNTKSNATTIPVSIRLERLTPFKIITGRDITLNNVKDEQTAFRFTVNAQGEVTSVNHLPKSLISQHVSPAP